ncbi:MAG TPA: lipocalin family protein, partial [Treponemataceae bacterium]|nr:lipocalin family protein [Treponemataceae bacterium]
FPFVWMPYRIVYWNAEDETMLITSGTMNYLWVMARAPLLDSAVYDRLTAEADRLGFDIALLETVPQRPERGL